MALSDKSTIDNRQSTILRTFRDKPERVIRLPETVLSKAQMDACGAMTGLAIVEIAGRDSVAAAIEAVKTEGFTDLLPTYVYTGTEYGDWNTVPDAVGVLSDRLPDVRVHPLLVLGSPQFWQALNGRFSGVMQERYGAFSPCVGCHLYLHSVRIPIATTLGRCPIIAGERELHGNSTKVNQIAEALNRYRDLTGAFGIPLLFPLQHISRGDHIEHILGCVWDEGKAQLKCVLSGNYRDAAGGVVVDAGQVAAYLEDYALPLTRAIIEGYLKGEVPNHLKLANRILETNARPKT